MHPSLVLLQLAAAVMLLLWAVRMVRTGVERANAAALKSALDDERLANAQLEERVKAIRSKQDTQVSALETKVRGQKEVLARLEGELSRLRQATEALRASNLALREANEAGVGKPELINDGLRAELESLHAERAAERAEVETVLALMTPLLEDAAAGGTTDTEEMA